MGRLVSRISRVEHLVAAGNLDADPGVGGGSRKTTALTAAFITMIGALRDPIAASRAATVEAEQARFDTDGSWPTPHARSAAIIWGRK